MHPLAQIGRHLLRALLVMALPGLGMPVLAASPADCQRAYQQCHQGCRTTAFRIGREAYQQCNQDCQTAGRQCLNDSGANPHVRQRRAGPAPERAPAPAPAAAPAEPTPSPADASATPAGASSGGDYEGPIRFAPRYAQTAARRDDRVPLHSQQIEPASRGVINNDDAIVRRRQPGEPPSLYSQVQALDNAGYMGLACQYGPMKSEGGYSVATFWHQRRGPMSEALVQAVRRYNGIDVALQDCPPTYGDAMRIASGRQAAPSAASVAAAAAEQQQRTGMRYVPATARLTAFDDTRRLHHQRVTSPVDLFGAGRSELAAVLAQARIDARQYPSAAYRVKLHEAGQQGIRCEYVHETAWQPTSGRSLDALSPASPGDGNLQAVTVHAWFGQRPEAFEADFFRTAENSGLTMLDIALARCPATYGLLLATLNGGAQALATANQAAEAAGLASAARRRNSDADDAGLVRRLQTEIAGLEDGSARLQPEGFSGAVRGRIQPLMQTLAASALARADGLDMKDSRAFEAWDQSHGGPLLTSIHRLYLLAVRKAFRWEHEGASLPDFLASGTQIDNEQTSWYRAALSQRFTRGIFRELMAVYERREAVGPLLDARFMEQSRQASRLGPAPAYQGAARPADGNRGRESYILFGTPGQIAAAQVAIEAGRSLGNAAAEAGQAKAEYAQLGRTIDSRRQAFWQCYARRCADAGTLYRAYSASLRDKDLHHLYQPAMYRRMEGAVSGGGAGQGILGRLTMFLGSGGVDNGNILGCESEANAVASAVQQSLFNPGSGNVYQAIAAGFQTFGDTPQYRQWQQCRDRMEVLLRPR